MDEYVLSLDMVLNSRVQFDRKDLRIPPNGIFVQAIGLLKVTQSMFLSIGFIAFIFRLTDL